MDWENLKISMIGRDAEDKVTVLGEADGYLEQIAGMVVDERYGDAGTITIKVDVARVGGEAISVAAKCKATFPSRKKKALTGIITEDGDIVTQRAVQGSLPLEGRNVVKLANQGEGED